MTAGLEFPGVDGVVVELVQADGAVRVLLPRQHMPGSPHHRVVPSSFDSSEYTGDGL